MAVAVACVSRLTDSDSGSVGWPTQYPVAVSIRSFLRRNGWSKAALLAALFLALGLAIGLWRESSEQRRLAGMAQKMRERET